MKNSKLLRRGRVAQTLGLTATLIGVIAVGCTDTPLDLRPTLGGGSAGRAGAAQTSGGNQSQDPGDGAGGDAGGEGPVLSHGGSGGKGGAGGSSGGTGGNASSALCGNGHIDGTEECDDGNKVSGDGCSSACKSSCETCERTQCSTTQLGDVTKAAFTVEGVAQQGPSPNTPRIDLVRNLLKCVYENKCLTVGLAAPYPGTETISLNRCICSNPLASTDSDISAIASGCKDEATAMKGPCYKEIKAAAEADTNPEIYARVTNRNYASGLAYNLLWWCDARVCPSQCIPTEYAACVGQGCSPAAGGGTGGTGGTATGGTAGTTTGGTGGTGGASAPVCGNGVREPGEECEPPNTPACSNDCHGVATDACVKVEAHGSCAPLATACTTSPGTATPEAQAACYDVEECVFSSQCAYTPPFTKCFCGGLSLDACGSAPETGASAPGGACAAIIKAGMGAGATNADVLARFTDANYPAGAALKRFTCMDSNPGGSCGYHQPCPLPPIPPEPDCVVGGY